MTAQDGEGLVTEEMVSAGRAAMKAHWRETGGSYMWDDLVRAILAAVAPDIAAQARRECAEEAAAWIEDYAGPDPSPASPEWWAGYREAQADAARMVRSMEWSESGRTPPDESS